MTGTEGGKALSGIKVQGFQAKTGAASGDPRTIEADCLLVSGGWSPVINLASQAGAKAEWNERLQAFLPPKEADGWVGAGGFNGTFSLESALAEGRVAGGGKDGDDTLDVVSYELDIAPAPVFEIEAAGKAFVDFQHDVTADDVRLAHREGFFSVEHLKRYTTLGMATDQGKTSNIPGLAIMANALGKQIPEVGTTRFRPPFAPVTIGALAAERYGEIRPERLTPMHDWHLANGATMYSAGLWHRPMIYGLPGETVEQAYVREASDDARGGRHRRRLDARQDHGPGAGRGGFPRPRLHQHLLDAAGRQGTLWADAARGRAGARRRHDLAARRAGFPDDHDHGERRQGDAASGISARRDLARTARCNSPQ